LRLRGNEHNVGYMPLNSSASRASRVEGRTDRPNLVEAFFVKRDLAPDHPDVIANKRFRSTNQWPDDLPGFRETVVGYCEALEALCLGMLPVYARALDLAPDFFEEPFRDPQFTLRMSHYPPAETGDGDQFGIAPHTDSSFLTMLAQTGQPGLQVRLPDGVWRDVPSRRGAIVVNSGDMLRRWANHRVLSTPHRATNRTPGGERYAFPFFFDANIDYPMACLPTCCGPDNPPRYEPITYMDYMLWFTRQNYEHVRDKDQTEAADPGVPATQSGDA
jgi:isopenicillin N synthase-like dioxygenase